MKSSLAVLATNIATAAQTKMQKLFSSMVPSVYALTPPLLVVSRGATVTLGKAWMVIKEIEFEANELADGNEVNGDDIEFEGPSLFLSGFFESRLI